MKKPFRNTAVANSTNVTWPGTTGGTITNMPSLTIGPYSFGHENYDGKSTVVTEKDSKKFTEYFEILHNADYDRDLTQGIIDGSIAKLRKLGYSPNKIITNHDTLMRLQNILETMIGSIKTTDKDRSEQILLMTFLTAHIENGILTKYRGLDIVIDKVPTDTISRIYVCENDRAGIEIRDLK